MSLRLMTAAGLLVMCAAPLRAQQCNAPGYALQVAAADGATLDSAFLHEAARVVAHRWATPSVRRGDFVMWRRVRERAIPEIPRWADDWRPVAANATSVVLVLRRRGRAGISEPSPSTGDRLFDRSLESIVRDPLPGSPELPAIPSSVSADSLALRIDFGATPEAPVPGVIRFAAIQAEVILTPGTLNVQVNQRAPTSMRNPSAVATAAYTATVKYDVTADGQVDPRSIQLIEVGDRDFGRAVQDALIRARFTPATTNCQPVRISVIQRFGN
jgi:hypothetical protein